MVEQRASKTVLRRDKQKAAKLVGRRESLLELPKELMLEYMMVAK
jgi:hypothetical protein